jgi:hypothetical protein
MIMASDRFRSKGSIESAYQAFIEREKEALQKLSRKVAPKGVASESDLLDRAEKGKKQ